jgi:glycosyltransferase involved in cell wall biosynthesis
MAAGVPVVASRIGGIPELVKDGETGFLVEPGNAAELADRLRELLGDTVRARAMGLAGRGSVEAHHDLERTLDTLERTYRELVSSPAAIGRAV